MREPTPAERICGVAAAAAHDLNEDLTVILSSVTASLRCVEPGHPARQALLDLQSAAQRCAWSASALLNFAARRGTQPTSETLAETVQDLEISLILSPGLLCK